MHSERLLRNYFHAKDENRPRLLDEVFAPDARLEVRTRSDQISLPESTVGRDAIADVLVRRFNQVYENIYSFYMNRPASEELFLSCDWLVVMTEKASRSIRVGCGRYDWTLQVNEAMRVESLVIKIEEMMNLGSSLAGLVWRWVDALHYPWTSSDAVVGSLPLDQLRPVIEYFRRGESSRSMGSAEP